jgi:hypothetical protein
MVKFTSGLVGFSKILRFRPGAVEPMYFGGPWRLQSARTPLRAAVWSTGRPMNRCGAQRGARPTCTATLTTPGNQGKALYCGRTRPQLHCWADSLHEQNDSPTLAGVNLLVAVVATVELCDFSEL